ncbi:hypothetical protein ACIRON_02965 [Nocardioides sp. NPDC101246]|uniref:hypothetical protein n=1 Tax=Nocardioides sp. NPDC101246 TaxID=3364336 RepID=UPI0037FC012E
MSRHDAQHESARLTLQDEALDTEYARLAVEVMNAEVRMDEIKAKKAQLRNSGALIGWGRS